MNKIKKLPALEAQKIAAGEVVERPANIIKELLENSIDAGADTITLYLEEAGKKLIRIIDNGYGMSEDDAQLCFAHHATSKIATIHDLDAITSFGFRGEALASIASVSKTTLITMEKDTAHATQVIIEGGTQISCTHTSHAQGTELIIKDIFYNVPARQKFLKTTQTELRLITTIFQAFCFDYPMIHFTLYSEGSVLYTCPACKTIEQRTAQLWPAQEAENMIPLERIQKDSLSIDGIISNHQQFRYDKSHLFIFVNKRLIKNQHLIKSLLKGYDTILPPNRYPTGIIYITIAQHELDVNVHPRKQEVQFLHQRIVDQALQEAIRKTLTQHTHTTLQHTATQTIHSEQTQKDRYPWHIKNEKPFFTTSTVSNANWYPTNNILKTSYQPQSSIHEPIFHNQSVNSELEIEYNCIGQLHKTYILAESSTGLVLIDQHAAHERILYEQFKSKFGSIAQIQLIFPETFILTHQESKIVQECISLFEQHGITLEQLSETSYIVRTTPVFLKNCSILEIIREITALLIDQPDGHITKAIHEKIHAQMACKAAIKAGDDLSKEHMHTLLRDLQKTENRSTCPHGRPTIWHISLHEIERKFKRRL